MQESEREVPAGLGNHGRHPWVGGPTADVLRSKELGGRGQAGGACEHKFHRRPSFPGELDQGGEARRRPGRRQPEAAAFSDLWLRRRASSSQEAMSILPDAAPTNWVDRLAPPSLRPWLKLGRFDRPAGIW